MSAVALAADANAGISVVFRMNTEINEIKSKAAGRPIYDEYEVCDISFAANRQTSGTFRAHEMSDWATDEYGMRYERTYAQKYNAQYLAFKEGSTPSAQGTPLEELPFLTQAKRSELKALKIYTAESLASLDGQPLKTLGMGGRELKEQAQGYLDTASKGANTEFLKSELAKRDTDIAAMREQIADLQLARGKVQNESAQSLEEPPASDKWDGMSDEDIANWLTEAGVEVDGRWKRKTLIERADGILATQGRKKN